MKHIIKKIRLGSTGRKVLLLLQAGLALSLTTRPDVSVKIVKGVAREWNTLHQQSLRDNIRKLYQSKLIAWKDRPDGTVNLVLTAGGKKKALQYNIDSISLEKPQRWDGKWRVLMFDIPEDNKKGRDALAQKLVELHFYPIQKSVFVHPYECKDEIDFILEVFDLVPYVRFLRTDDIDIALHLKQKFKLI